MRTEEDNKIIRHIDWLGQMCDLSLVLSHSIVQFIFTRQQATAWSVSIEDVWAVEEEEAELAALFLFCLLLKSIPPRFVAALLRVD